MEFFMKVSLGMIISRHWLVWAILSLLVLPSVQATERVQQAPTNTADIVVQFGNGAVIVRRISFTGTISGIEALRKTGLDLIEKNGAICRIGDTGCGDQNCFCGCPAPYNPCLFWSYQRWDGKTWVESQTGAAQTSVANGAVEGWTWGRKLPRVTPALLAAHAGLDYLGPLQGLDGSYLSGNVGLTIDTLLALRALGGDASTWQRAGGASLLDALRSKAAPYASKNVASMGKLALGVAAADQDPRSFVGLDLVLSMTASLDTNLGSYGTTNWDQAFAMLGLRAAGENVPAAAITQLKNRANSDGSWGFVTALPGDTGDIDSTGLAVQALIAAGVPISDTVISKALSFLDLAQNADGGFPNQLGTDSNANSTALAIQGLVAAGENPQTARWKPAATTPISYLLSLQQPDGAITYGGQASMLATQQSIPALVGKPFPYLSRAVAKRLGVSYIRSQQQPNGSFAGFGVGSTIDAMLALSAADVAPQSVKSSTGKSALDYLQSQAASYAASSAAAAGKLSVGLAAAGQRPQDFAGLNLVISNTLRYDPKTGAYGSSTYDQAWAMLGLKAAGVSIPVSATERLRAMASPGGGWGFSAKDVKADPDSTGLALMALLAAEDKSLNGVLEPGLCSPGAGSSDARVRDGLAFLGTVQNVDAGFPGYDGSTSPSSSGLALQGLAAAHELPRGLSWSTWGSLSPALSMFNPVDGLLGLQTSMGGFPGFSGPNDPDSTYQTLAGLLGRSYPSQEFTLLYLPMIRR